MSSLLQFLLLCCISFNALALTELESIDHLAPMPGPDKRNIGWEWHFTDQDGKPGFMRKVDGDDLEATYTRTDGCRWTRSTSGFAPAISWSGCPSSGTSSVELVKGKIWPLDTGQTFQYRIRGNSSLLPKAWSSSRSCEVTGQVRIEIRSGIHDTFKVVCKERWGTRTWWLSPEVGTAVAYRQTTKRGKIILQEMDRIVSP